jgi:hypothetical protein
MPRTRGAKDKKPRQRLPVTLEEKFWQYTIELPNGCIQWVAGIDASYYGEFYVAPDKIIYAHRYAWEADRGPIPDGLQVDHLCHNRGCVNVKHMQLIKMTENPKATENWGYPMDLLKNDDTTDCNREHIKYAR